MAPFRGTSASQFPAPEHIYKKNFAFLSAPLGVIQSQSQTQRLKPQELAKSPLPSLTPVAEFASSIRLQNMIGKEAKEEDKKQDLGKEIQRESNDRVNEKSKGKDQNRDKSRFGVQLTEGQKNEESDDSIIIPEPIQSILDKLRGPDCAVANETNLQQMHMIDSLTLSKCKPKSDPCIPVSAQWIEDLLLTEDNTTTYPRPEGDVGAAMAFSKSPVLLSEGDLVSLSAEQKEKYYNVSYSRS